MLILLNKMDLLPTSAQAPAALTSALPQHGWVVSLALQVGTGEFLVGLAMALEDRCVVPPLINNFICDWCMSDCMLQLNSHAMHAGIIFSKMLMVRMRAPRL
jgi:hypothetical protein